MQKNEDFYLKKEFDEWDTLSDEALQNFEGSLYQIVDYELWTLDNEIQFLDFRFWLIGFWTGTNKYIEILPCLIRLIIEKNYVRL